jgi:hypothetical protein
MALPVQRARLLREGAIQHVERGVMDRVAQ